VKTNQDQVGGSRSAELFVIPDLARVQFVITNGFHGLGESAVAARNSEPQRLNRLLTNSFRGLSA
jgi:hypothetical protein